MNSDLNAVAVVAHFPFHIKSSTVFVFARTDSVELVLGKGMPTLFVAPCASCTFLFPRLAGKSYERIKHEIKFVSVHFIDRRGAGPQRHASTQSRASSLSHGRLASVAFPLVLEAGGIREGSKWKGSWTYVSFHFFTFETNIAISRTLRIR